MSQPITVLVVEDEPLILLEVVDDLVDRGFVVLEATNAAEAIVTLIDHPEIEILFTDVDMPGGMDGLMLAAAVRDRWPPIKIIVTSGHRNVNVDDIPTESRFFGKPYQSQAVSSAMVEMMAMVNRSV